MRLMIVLLVLLPALADAVGTGLSADIEGMLAAATEARQMGRLDEAQRSADAALAAARARQSAVAEGRALHELGEVAMERNDYPLAMQQFRRAEAIFATLEDPTLLANVYNRIGMTYRYQVDYPAALDYLYRALAIYETQENLEQIGNQYNGIGVVIELTGQLEEALRWHQQSLEIDRLTGDLSGTASSLYNIGEIFRDLGDLDEALIYFQDALALDQQVGEPKNIAYSHHKIAAVHVQQGDLEAARPHVMRALELFRQIETPRDTDWATSTLAEIEMRSGNLDEADRLLALALDRSLARGSRSLITNLRLLLAELELLRGGHPEALAQIEQGINEARAQDEADKQARLLGLKARVLEAQQDYAGALAALRAQQAIEDELVDRRRIETLAMMQGSAEFVRRAQQIDLLKQQHALQDAELAQQRFRRNSWIGGLVVAFIIVLLVQGRISQARLNRRLATTVEDQTRELRGRKEELEQAYRAVQETALSDQLTGLRNRRFLAQYIEADVERVRQQHQPSEGSGERPPESDLVFFLIDMDHFKSVNDSHGHAAGDLVLVQVPGLLRQVFREDDYLIRWGGEEFMVVARFVAFEAAPALAERLRSVIEAHPFDVGNNARLTLTCSIGFAAWPFVPAHPDRVSWQGVVDIADFCLYAAKATSRNAWVGLEAGADFELTGNLHHSLRTALTQAQVIPHSSADLARIVWS